ncbi:MAG TPA: multidrug ABC transporter permease [Micavibrio sp.]|nr:multidrug ABC transporter permease [Micavibrio sp.]
MTQTTQQNTAANSSIEPRFIGQFNRIGLMTLVKKEVGRFLNVYMQTIIAPVVTTLLFYTVFALAFGGITQMIGEIPYLVFLAPGLIMMTMVQNAFSNTSSSIVISKVQGNIVDVLMPPLSATEIYIGFILGGLLRGLCVGLCAGIVMALFVPIHIHSIPYIIGFAFMGTMMLASLGLAGGIWSEKFDHIAAVTNFLVTPLTFLSGTFYSIERLPEVWQTVAHYNPFFHMIDGFRYGFIGQADGSPLVGLMFLAAINVLLMVVCLRMLKTGYKIKS